MRALVIGAGAIGTVYARHLVRAGVDVTFYVRPSRTSEVRRGIRYTPLNEGKTADTLRCAAVSQGDPSYDLVIVTVPSDALRGAWLDTLMADIGSSATVLLLSPGLDDRDRILECIAEERLVQGMITAIAWRAPLPGESIERSLAYWLPPGRAPVWGARAEAVARVLTSGGLTTTVLAERPEPAGAAVLMPIVASLEASGWSFERWVGEGWLPVTARAIREALDAAGSPWWRTLIRSWTLRLALWVAPFCVPFPLEAYLRVHFSKLGTQTRMQLDGFMARSTGDTGGLRALREALESDRSAVMESPPVALQVS